MTNAGARKDLVILAADKNMEFTLRGLMGRPESLGIRAIDFDVFVHPAKDPGCRDDAHTFLRAFSGQYRHGLVMLDREGSGRESRSPADLEREIEQKLSQNGWGDRATAIVLDPELEIWVWSDSPVVDEALGWPIDGISLRDALSNAGFLDKGAVKPADPKGAMEFALRKSGTPRSSSIYRQIAQRVSLKRCEDPALLKLRATLQRWFGVAS